MNGNKVSSYQFEGFDFVGTPSTGLRAKPEIVTDKKKSTYAESMQDDKVVDYICENVVNNQVKQSERNVMAEQTSFKEFQAVMQESVKHIKGSRSISDAHSRIAMVESKFPTLNIDAKSAAFGQASINEVFREWDEEKSSVVNSFETKPEQETTNGGAGENKDSMQMKDATKESAESIQESKNKAVRLAKHLRNTQVDLFRESKRVVGISAVAAKDKKSLTEAKRLLSEATTRVASAQQRLVSESTKSAKLADENAKLREALMATRKESIALKVIKESQAKATARVSRRERQLMRENAELKKVASDLNAEVGNESSLEVRASNVCAALEMALEESVTKCVTLERQLKEERKKNLQK